MGNGPDPWGWLGAHPLVLSGPVVSPFSAESPRVAGSALGIFFLVALVLLVVSYLRWRRSR